METRKRRKRKTDILPITDDYTPKESAIWHCNIGCDAPTFKVDYVSEDIGKGVFALQHFKKGDFLVEYSGELLTRVEAEMRERKYPAKLGSYMYFFQYSGHSYCIDATQYECVGRYVNDATGPQKNAVTRIIEVESKPHIALFSTKSIQKGDEIIYDYGVGNLYWRKKRNKTQEDTTSDRVQDEAISDRVQDDATPDLVKDNATFDLLQDDATSDRVQKDTTTDRVQEDATTDRVQDDATTDRVREDATTDRVQDDATTDRVQEDATTDRVQDNATTDRVREDATTDRVRENATTDRVKDDATTHCVQEDASTDRVQDDATSDRVQDDATSDRVQEDATTDRVQDDATSDLAKDNVTSDRVQDGATSDRVQEDATTDRVQVDATSDLVQDDATTHCIQEDATTDRAQEDATTNRVQDDATSDHVQEDATTDRLREDATTDRVQDDATTNRSQDDATSDRVQDDATSDLEQEDATTDRLREDATTNRSQDDATSDRVQDDATSDLVKDNVTSDRVQDDATSDRVQEDVTTDRVQVDATSDLVQDDATSDRVQEDATTDRVREDATTNRVKDDATTNRSQDDATSDRIQDDATSDLEQDCATSDLVQDDATSDHVQEDATTDRVREDATTNRVKDDATTNRSQDDATSDRIQDDATADLEQDCAASDLEQDCATSDLVQDDATSDRVQEDATTDRVQVDATSDLVQDDATSDLDDATFDLVQDNATYDLVQDDATTVREQVNTTSDRVKDDTNTARVHGNTTSDRVQDDTIVEDSCDSTRSTVYQYYGTELSSYEQILNGAQISSDTEEIGKEVDTDLEDSQPEDVKLPTSYPEVIIPRYEPKETGKRAYNKRQACYFCSKLCSKMARHLRDVHSEETQIAKILAMKGKEKIAHELERFRLLGNFNHNLEVLQRRNGELIVSRRSSSTKVVEDYLPCIYCYSFIDVHEIWRHVSSCWFNEGTEEMDNDHFDDQQQTDEKCHKGQVVSITTRCRMLLAGASSFTLEMKRFSQLKELVIDGMRSGAEKKVIEQDQIILIFGTTLLEKRGKSQKHSISTKMRQLARLLLQMRKKQPYFSLSDCLCGQQFDEVVKATKHICGNSEFLSMKGVKMMCTPSLGLHIGYSLAKAIEIKNGQAIRQQNQKWREEVLAFKELFQAEWTDKISSQALQTLVERKYNKEELLPLTSDLLKVTEMTSLGIKKYTNLLDKQHNQQTWIKLCKIIFVSVTLFNKRRGGEVAKMHVSCYTNRPKWREVQNEEMLQGLNQMERKLVERFDMLHLPGKRNRRVPMILKPEVVTAMDLLVKTRRKCQVQSLYFFAIPGKQSHIHPWKVLHDFAVESKCSKPELVSSTKLRKYTATVIQLLSLSESQVEWLSNHLGHKVDIHKDIYRQHESTVELAKVSKILLAVEQGKVAKYKGRKLEDIHISESEDEKEQNCEDPAIIDHEYVVPEERSTIPLIEESESDSDSTSRNAAEPGERRKRKRVEPGERRKGKRVVPLIEESESDSDSTSRNAAEPGERRKRKRVEPGERRKGKRVEPDERQKRKRVVPLIEEESDSDSTSRNNAGNTSGTDEDTQRSTKKQQKRVAWKEDEINTIVHEFAKFIFEKTIPRKRDIQTFLNKHQTFHRSEQNIKSRIQYIIKNK